MLHIIHISEFHHDRKLFSVLEPRLITTRMTFLHWPVELPRWTYICRHLKFRLHFNDLSERSCVKWDSNIDGVLEDKSPCAECSVSGLKCRWRNQCCVPLPMCGNERGDWLIRLRFLSHLSVEDAWWTIGTERRNTSHIIRINHPGRYPWVWFRWLYKSQPNDQSGNSSTVLMTQKDFIAVIISREPCERRVTSDIIHHSGMMTQAWVAA